MALAAFVTGVAGALLAGADRELFSINFPIQNSIELLAVVLMGGAFALSGAVIAALLQSFLPALLQNWGVANDWLIILFGVGVMQVLATAPGGIADQFPKDMKRLYRLISRAWRRPARVAAAPAGPRRERRAHHDRGHRPDRQVRRRDVARRHEPAVRGGRLRPHRPERRGQDHVLQRAFRLRAARVGRR